MGTVFFIKKFDLFFFLRNTLLLVNEKCSKPIKISSENFQVTHIKGNPKMAFLGINGNLGHKMTSFAGSKL